jgi:REP element-mobilizing transposase RayT
MSRRLRFIPEGGALVEVTCRTVHGRFLLLPRPELNEILVGILARAQQRYEVSVCAYVFASNHYHLLLHVQDADRLARFMNYVNGNVAREAGRLAEWKEKFWSRRYESILISEEPEAQTGRLKYVLSHGAKENLVARPEDWPGAHAVHALLEGVSIEGLWFSRAKEYGARRQGQEFDRLKYATAETLHLSPLPCWKDLSETQQRERVTDLVREIEAEAAAERERTGIEPPGPAAIRAQKPHDRPNRSKKSPAPFCHAASKAVRRELYEAYAWFVGCFRQAAEKWKAGDLTASFPSGSFPPGRPFVTA